MRSAPRPSSSSTTRPIGRCSSRCPTPRPCSTGSSPSAGSRWETDGHPGRTGRGRRSMPELTYLQAISDGLREEMRADETVFCMGEDIGAFGGAFKVTDGFFDEFGSDRVWDMPLAEQAIIGTAAACAIEGLKPVAQIQFADIIAC